MHKITDVKGQVKVLTYKHYSQTLHWNCCVEYAGQDWQQVYSQKQATKFRMGQKQSQTVYSTKLAAFWGCT